MVSPYEWCVVSARWQCNMNKEERLLEACGAGRIEEVQCLLDAGADASWNDSRVLFRAANFGHTHVAQLLLDLPPERRVNCAVLVDCLEGLIWWDFPQAYVQSLLRLRPRHGMLPAELSRRMLRIAAVNSSTSVIALLCARNVPPAPAHISQLKHAKRALVATAHASVRWAGTPLSRPRCVLVALRAAPH